MVEFKQNGNQTRLVLTPNKSMTWETNKKILFIMFIVSMMIGLSFASIGAWVVLPFTGLEIFLITIKNHLLTSRRSWLVMDMKITEKTKIKATLAGKVEADPQAVGGAY